MHNGVTSKQPVTSKSNAIYEIRLKKSDDDCISDRNRWDGSYFLDDIQTLRMFTSILNRFKSYGDAYYYIYNLTYTIRLHLNEIEVETGFDFNIFQTEFSKWVDELVRDDESDIENTDAYGNYSSSHTYEFQTKLTREQLRLMLIESDKDLDNKEMYESLIKKIKIKLSKYSKYIDVNFSFENSKKYKYTKKSGFFSKPKELCYSFYVLSVSIKRKKSTF